MFLCVRLCLCVKVAVKIVKRAGLPEDDEKALKDEVRNAFYERVLRHSCVFDWFVECFVDR